MRLAIQSAAMAEVVPMWSKFASRLRKTIFLALEEAGRAGQEEASAEHLLIAMLRDADGSAAIVLRRAGADPDAIRTNAVRKLPGAKPLPERAERFSAFALQALDVATGVAQRVGHPQVGPEHVLLALLEINKGPASVPLTCGGVQLDAVREQVERYVHERIPQRQSRAQQRRPSFVNALLSPIERLVHLGSLGWRVYVQKSIGHPGFFTDPYPLYDQLRTRWPVRRDPVAPVWVLSRYEDVSMLLRDPRFRRDPFLSDSLPEPMREQLGMPRSTDAEVEGEPLAMLFLDPPRHTRIRGLFNRAFSARAMQNLRGRIQQITDKRLDKWQDCDEVDLIAELAVPLPIVVIAELVGFPPEDYAQLKKWSDDFAAALAVNPTPQQQARSMQSREEMRSYFDRVVKDLQKHPRECLITTLLESDGLSRRELFANCTLLMAAGHETTTNLIGNGVLALLRHPEQRRLLQEKPEWIESAIEELLRYDSPVQWVARMAHEDIEMNGKTIPRGEHVLGSVGSANRDPAVFADADRLDLTRVNNKHLAFGYGTHYCIGAALARMEGQIAIGTLLRRFPNVTLASRRVRWNKNIIFRGAHELRLRLR